MQIVDGKMVDALTYMRYKKRFPPRKKRTNDREAMNFARMTRGYSEGSPRSRERMRRRTA